MKYAYVVMTRDVFGSVTIVGIYTSHQKAIDVIEEIDDGVWKSYEKIPLNTYKNRRVMFSKRVE